MNTLGDNITKFRKAAKITQGKLAEKVGISKTHLCQIENGKKDPSLSLLRDIAKHLSVQPAALLANDDKWLAIQNVMAQYDLPVIETLLLQVLDRLKAERNNSLQ